MKTLKLFPTILGVFDNLGISDSNIKNYKNYINTLGFASDKISSPSLEQSLLENPIFKTLENKILESSKEYLNSLNYVFEDLQICNSWATQSLKNHSSSLHNHANSYISGVYYLTSGSPIFFEDPKLDQWTFLLDKTDSRANMYSIVPKQDLLIIFPSFLKHQIQTHSEDIPRISIAFNIIPKGIIGIPTGYLSL